MMEYYNINAKHFFEQTVKSDMTALYEVFLKHVPPGGSILDAGCGSGRDSLAFLQMGFDVVAMDGCFELCQLAGAYIGQEVVHMRFEEVDFAPIFDGIWAAASLLHIPSDALEEVLGRLKKGLKKEGVLYASFKYGDFEGERKGRYFHDLKEKEAECIFTKLGFKIIKIWLTSDVREAYQETKWLNLLAQI